MTIKQESEGQESRNWIGTIGRSWNDNKEGLEWTIKMELEGQ